MDCLNYTEGAATASTGKTGLEPNVGAVPTTNTSENDSSIFQTVTGIFGKGLDLGIALTQPKPANVPVEEKKVEKIMGMPKPVFYGGLAIVGLIGAVLVVKKMKK